MSVIDTLIYDRTQSDITNDTDKAYIDYKDLNRVEEAVKFLSDLMNKYYYFNEVNVNTNWKISDIRKKEDCERIKNNYLILKNAYLYNFKVPDFKWETIEEDNEIEKILYKLNSLMRNIERNCVYSGVSSCGQNRIWQQRFRRYAKSLKQWLELIQVYWNEFSETETWEDIIYD